MKKIILSLLGGVFLSIRICFGLPNVSTMSIEEIDLLEFSNWDMSTFEMVINDAIILVEDTSKINQQRGHVLLGEISSFIQEEIRTKRMKPNEIHASLKALESQQYFINLPRPSNLKKCMYYLCEGRYQYIYDRASHVQGFFLALTICIGLFVLYFFNKLGWIREWLYQKKFIKLGDYIVLFLIVIFFIFKLTCKLYV